MVPEAVLPIHQNLPSAMGYGESKYVSELLLAGSPLINILRVGQIAGPVSKDATGKWNENEWFPSLVRTSKKLDMLPDSLGLFEEVDWIPIDCLSDIVVDLIHSDNNQDTDVARVFNLVNPSRVSFGNLVPSIKERLGESVKVVSFETWLQALKELDNEDKGILERYPALKIMGFFEDLQVSEGGYGKVFDTTEAEKRSKGMRKLQPITGDMVVAWMKQWGL